jgi:tetratricopeptide (TPR) repeat protein
VAETGGAVAGVTIEARGVLRSIEEDLATATVAAEQHARDLAMTPRLERVRLLGRHSSKLQESDAEFLAAFGDYGIDVDRFDEREVTDRVRSSRITGDLVAALDRWIWVRRRLGGPEDERAARFLRIAQAADEDPERVRVRRLASEEDAEGLRLLTTGALPGRDAAWLLALHLGHLREHEAAVEFLRRAQARHPGDFWLTCQLGRELTVLSPPRWTEAASFYRAALALRPQSLEVRHRLGFALARAGRPEEALGLWWDTLPLDDEPYVVYQHIVTIHEDRGTLSELLTQFEERIREDPEEPWVRLAKGLVHLVRGEFDEAVRTHEEAL